VKRETFLRELRHAGCLLKRHGKRHDLYTNPQNGRSAPSLVIPKSPTRSAR